MRNYFPEPTLCSLQEIKPGNTVLMQYPINAPPFVHIFTKTVGFADETTITIAGWPYERATGKPIRSQYLGSSHCVVLEANPENLAKYHEQIARTVARWEADGIEQLEVIFKDFREKTAGQEICAKIIYDYLYQYNYIHIIDDLYTKIENSHENNP